MRFARLLTGLLLGLTAVGCADFMGTIPVLKLDPEVELTKPVQRTGASLFVERPVIVDQDEEKDFTPLAEAYAASLPQRVAEYLCARGAFVSCTDKPAEGAFRLASKVVVENFRPAVGNLALTIPAGLLLPPVLGMAWSFPVGYGSCEYRAEWELFSPLGESLFRGKSILGDGFARCATANNTSLFLRKALEEVAPQLASAAQVATATLKAQGPRPRQILAVFDLQDVSGRFDEKVLGQLTAFLAASMTNSGPFDVVPREQLRERLVDEKKASYRACYDNACQIELGKAVSAQLTLATQLIQVGDKCAVVASLYDLKSETSKAAATLETGCEAGLLLGALKGVAEQIAGQVK